MDTHAKGEHSCLKRRDSRKSSWLGRHFAGSWQEYKTLADSVPLSFLGRWWNVELCLPRAECLQRFFLQHLAGHAVPLGPGRHHLNKRSKTTFVRVSSVLRNALVTDLFFTDVVTDLLKSLPCKDPPQFEQLVPPSARMFGPEQEG